MASRWLLAILLLILSASTTFAQDATEVDPDHYTLAFENDHVRVLRIQYGPGEKSVMHEHPAGVAVSLTGESWRMHLDDGTSVEAETQAGEPVWMDATTHMPENMSEEGAEVILIELKQPHAMKIGEGCCAKMHEGEDD